MNSSHFVFFGTPLFAVHVLDALERHGILPALIVTAPDRPAGRGRTLTPPPAKEWALERGIDVLQPLSLKQEEVPPELLNSEWDLFLVAAYGKIIPKHVLDIPQKGTLNVHPSLLPHFRGPSPALSAILADERRTGISIMLLDEEMDHGPVLAQASIEIPEEDWPPKGSVLEELLATEGGNLLAETIPLWIAGNLTPEEQDHAQATYTKKFKDEDARIDLARDPRENFLKIRAFDTSPRAYMLVNGKRVLITEAEFSDGTLRIIRVIPEGKREMAYEDFSRNRPGIDSNDQLG